MTMIKLTDSAITKLQALRAETGNPNLYLRAFVEGGGCSGFQYGFTFDDTVNEDDFEISQTVKDEHGSGELKLLVDAMSYQYLDQATIDYIIDLSGERFRIDNPNAKTTCGCGSSFSVAQSDEAVEE
jgi:iron-sulfur cluster insertion protein